MKRGTDRQTEKLLTDFTQVANLSGPGFFLEERLLMTALISLHTVDLFELPISSGFSFGTFYILRDSSISAMFSSFLEHTL